MYDAIQFFKASAKDKYKPSKATFALCTIHREENTNDPKISLNKIRFMEDVENSIKKEKETIINIIEEDILQKEEKKQKEKEEEEMGEGVEIEWNPEL